MPPDPENSNPHSRDLLRPALYDPALASISSSRPVFLKSLYLFLLRLLVILTILLNSIKIPLAVFFNLQNFSLSDFQLHHLLYLLWFDHLMLNWLYLDFHVYFIALFAIFARILSAVIREI